MVYADFLADLRQMLVPSLTALGLPVDAADNTEALLHRLLNFHHRRIEPRPRPVRWSRELRAREQSLAEDRRTALRNIEDASKRGDDLTPYLSRQLVTEPTAHDRQRNDWGFHHLHLGLGPDPKYPNLIAGTKELLFVVDRPDALYFIEVGDHHSFADEELFRVAESNWPELFKQCRADFVVPSRSGDGRYGTATRAKLRKAGLTTLTVASDGTFYVPTGGGFSTSGLSMDVLRESDRLLNAVCGLERWCRENEPLVIERVAQATGVRVTELRLKLSVEPDGSVRAVETQSNAKINVVQGVPLTPGDPPATG